VSTPGTCGPIASPPLERQGAEPGPHDRGPSPCAREGAVRATVGEAAQRKPHICFVAPSTWPLFSGDRDIPVVGGAEVQQSIVAPALAARGFRVSMIALDYGQPDRTVVKGVTVHKIYRPDEGIPVVRFIHPRLTSLWRALGQVDADIYYQRSAAALTGFVTAFCRAHGKRSVYSGASDVDFVPPHPDIRFARDRWLFEYGVRNVDRLFVQNPAQRELARTHFGRESVLVPNCYAPPPGARADRKGYVLWVATVRAQKRPEILLEIARRMPEYRFVIVGGADAGRRGHEYARGVRAALAGVPNVEDRGFVPFAEADRVFDGARVVLNTSIYEGFPNTFLQAWARGIPTVAFVDTGSRGPEGRPAYDIVKDVREASLRVERLMRDDAEWECASRRVAAHFLEHHSLQAVAQIYEGELTALARRP
jgi:glycosyltransferase involved in cell wall biosynthesis